MSRRLKRPSKLLQPAFSEPMLRLYSRMVLDLERLAPDKKPEEVRASISMEIFENTIRIGLATVRRMCPVPDDFRQIAELMVENITERVIEGVWKVRSQASSFGWTREFLLKKELRHVPPHTTTEELKNTYGEALAETVTQHIRRNHDSVSEGVKALFAIEDVVVEICCICITFATTLYACPTEEMLRSSTEFMVSKFAPEIIEDLIGIPSGEDGIRQGLRKELGELSIDPATELRKLIRE